MKNGVRGQDVYLLLCSDWQGLGMLTRTLLESSNRHTQGLCYFSFFLASKTWMNFNLFTLVWGQLRKFWTFFSKPVTQLQMLVLLKFSFYAIHSSTSILLFEYFLSTHQRSRFFFFWSTIVGMLLVSSFFFYFFFFKLLQRQGLQFITMLVNSHWLQIILHHGEFLQCYFVISVHFCLSCTAYFENFVSVCRICNVPECICVLCAFPVGVWWCLWRKPPLAAWQWTQWEAAAHLLAWQLAAAPTSLLLLPQTPKAWSIPRVGQTQG